jgi:L-alanine-DL-glutamate epimerase-like enolase superfamily enzyme
MPNLTWVEVEDDDGHVGLGETFYGAETVAAYVHESAAPYLLGEDPRRIQRHWTALHRQWGRSGIGAEARGASALDIALWDLLGRRAGLPLFQLLGGATRDAVPVYNTCGGPEYARPASLPADRLDGAVEAGRRYEDLRAFHEDAGRLARELLEMGITAMKIWPFDVVADEQGGLGISDGGLERGLRALRLVREAVGGEMDVALDLHGKWSLPAAKRIAAAAEELGPLWLEDPIRMDSVPALAELARSTRVPLVASETLGPRFPFRELLEQGAVGIVMADPGWVGGVTEARRVADLAGLYGRPFTPHDCTGPVGLAVGVHLCAALENALVQEVVRAYYYGWYGELAERLPPLERGLIRPLDAPGHGIRLRDEVRAEAVVRTTAG